MKDGSKLTLITIGMVVGVIAINAALLIGACLIIKAIFFD